MVLQRTSTIQFWDRYHNENASQEWIAQPNKELLELIFHQYWKQHHHCPNNNSKDDDDDDAGDDASSSSSSCTSRPSMISRNATSMYVLEIGCGTSNLLRDLKVHIESKIRALQVVACGTDVSNSCIDVQQTRQRQQKQKQKQHNRKNNKCSRSGGGTNDNDNDNEHDDLWYEVLNCLDDDTEQQKHLPTPSSSVSLSSPPALLLPSHRHHNRWDLIIDKGCLDTFMFRTRHRGEKNKLYPESVQKLLDNIHGWLVGGPKNDDGTTIHNATTTNNNNNNNNTGNDAIINDDERDNSGPDDIHRYEHRIVDRKRGRGKQIGCYMFISPRPKVKAVRDYAGFSSVRRFTVRGTTTTTTTTTEKGINDAGELVGKKNQEKKYSQSQNKNGNDDDDDDDDENNTKIIDEGSICASITTTTVVGYLYVCTKNPDYIVGVSEPFRNNRTDIIINNDTNKTKTIAATANPIDNDNIRCPNCGITFYAFRKGELMEFRGTNFWIRRFNGHCTHCTSSL